MGFHFNSQLHDRTEKRENAEIKFYINAGEDSFKVAKLFLDKWGVSENVLFTSVFAYTLSRFTGSDKVSFNIIEMFFKSNLSRFR